MYTESEPIWYQPKMQPVLAQCLLCQLHPEVPAIGIRRILTICGTKSHCLLDAYVIWGHEWVNRISHRPYDHSYLSNRMLSRVFIRYLSIAVLTLVGNDENFTLRPTRPRRHSSERLGHWNSSGRQNIKVTPKTTINYCPQLTYDRWPTSRVKTVNVVLATHRPTGNISFLEQHILLLNLPPTICGPRRRHVPATNELWFWYLGFLGIRRYYKPSFVARVLDGS